MGELCTVYSNGKMYCNSRRNQCTVLYWPVSILRQIDNLQWNHVQAEYYNVGLVSLSSSAVVRRLDAMQKPKHRVPF